MSACLNRVALISGSVVSQYFQYPVLLLDWTSQSSRHFANCSAVFISGHQHCYCVHSSCLTCCVLSCCTCKPFNHWALAAWGSEDQAWCQVLTSCRSWFPEQTLWKGAVDNMASVRKHSSVFFHMHTLFTLPKPTGDWQQSLRHCSAACPVHGPRVPSSRGRARRHGSA